VERLTCKLPKTWKNAGVCMDNTPATLLFTGPLRVDQQRRWERGDHRLVEDYLQERPELQSDHDALLDLVYGEYCLRATHGEQPALTEYSARFPHLADDLQRMVVMRRQSAETSMNSASTLLPNPDGATGRGAVPSPGQERFRVLRPHAQGGLGAVSLAFDTELSRQVALKEILPHHADQAESRARFIAEAEITGRLEHPGIVPVYGMGAYADGRPYYAMRFIHGESLKEAIDAYHREKKESPKRTENALALRRLLRHFLDACNAIHYAHSRGVLHRDIKPANIMLGKFGETLVVDWGLAKAMGKSTANDSHGSIVGAWERRCITC
jgi:tRNA A-37 threonylcarbamoyl transferase component Bud32